MKKKESMNNIRHTMGMKGGFTLVELLLYLGIASVVIVVISTLALDVLMWKVRFGVSDAINQNGRFATEMITRTVRDSVSISVPVRGQASSTLSLETKQASTTPTIFTSREGKVWVQIGGQEAVALTTQSVHVDSLLFRNVSMATNTTAIRLELAVSGYASSTRIEYSEVGDFITTARSNSQ